MKSIIKINEMQVTSINQLYSLIGEIQLNHGFTPVNFEFIDETNTLNMDGLITEVIPLGESRIQFTIMYHFKDNSDGREIAENTFNIYTLEDIFHCNIWRGFRKIIVSEGIIDDLDRGE